MTKQLFLSVFVLFFIATSCKKDDIDCREQDDDYDTCLMCDNNDQSFEDFHHVEAGVEQEILVPIETDSDCGFIISGKVKYTKDGKTVAIVDYGDGEIDGLATKILFGNKDRDCKDDDDGDYSKSGGKHHGKKKGDKIKCMFEQPCVTVPASITSTKTALQ